MSCPRLVPFVEGSTRSISRFAAGFLLAIAVVCLAPATAEAQIKTWFGTVSGNWSDPNNWSGGAVPSGTTQLRWSSASTGTLTTNNDISGLTSNGMVFTGAPGPVTIGGNSLAISTTTSAVSIQTGAQAVTIDMPLSMRFGTLTLTTSGGGPLTINGVISESGVVAGLSFAGTSGWGELTLNGSNTFSGGVNPRSGTMTIGNLGLAGTPQALGSGTILNLGRSTAAEQGFVRYTGPATTTNLRVQLGQVNNALGGGGFLNDGTGAVIWTGSMVVATAATTQTRSFTLGGSNVDDNQWQASIVDRSPAAPVAFTKAGAGKWILSGSNTYTGATSITGGLLVISSTGRINTTSGVTVNGSGAEFKYNSATAYTQPLTVTQGTVSGTGTISASGGVTIGSNAVISPGNSPGIQAYTTGLTWANGGSYLWEINDWTGAAGTAYDQVQVTGGQLNITATGGGFTINIASLSGTASGGVANFSNTTKSFVIATTLSGSQVGFSASNFTLSGTSQFASLNSGANGTWSITNTATSVLLNYTVAAVTSSTYTLASTAGASAIRVGGTTGITATVQNTGAGTSDSIVFNTLAVGNGVTLSPTSGTLATGSSSAGSGVFTGATAGVASFGPSATVTNLTAGGSPTLASSSTATVSVYQTGSQGSVTSPGSFGIIRTTGSFSNATVWVSNVSTGSTGFVEGLSASTSTLGSGTVVSNSISNIFNSGSGSVVVGLLNNGVAGAKSGTAWLSFQSTGTTSTGATGLSPLSTGSNSLALTGTVVQAAAQGSVASTVGLGVVRVGDAFTSSNVFVSNTAGGTVNYQEGLSATTGTAGGATVSGAINNLYSGSSSVAVSFGNTSTAGFKSGTVTLTFQSTGTTALGATGLSPLSLGSSDVVVSGSVVQLAAQSVVSSVSLGAVRFGDSFNSSNLWISNTAGGPVGYQEGLSASITGSAGSATGSGAVNNLFSGSSSGISLGLGASGVGQQSGTITLSFVSTGTTSTGATGLNTYSLGSSNVTVTGTVYNPAANNSINGTVSLGNVRVGDSFGTSSVSIWNTATAATGFQEGLSATISGTGGQASGSGSVSNLITGTSTNISVGLAGTGSSGVRNGSINVTFETTGTTSTGATGLAAATLGTGTVSVTGTVWNPAVANVTSGSSVNLGRVITGASLTSTLAIQNAAPNDGFSEKLNAFFNSSTGDVVSTSGSISLLGPQLSNSTNMTVGLDTSSAGVKTGSAEVGFETDGFGTSGLAPASLSPQTLQFSGTVLAHSTASLSASLLTSTTITIGQWNWTTSTWEAGTGSSAFSLFNIASTSPASLTAALDVTGTSFSGDSQFSSTFNLGTYSLINGGTSSMFYAVFTPTGTTNGEYYATFTFNTADENLPGWVAGNTLTLTARVIVVPEPASIGLSGVGLAFAGLMFWRRRRPAA